MTPFKKAEKKQAKLRLAIFGPSGAGKTYSALRIAKGLGGSIALIDTENKSACKYADRFEFDVAELQVANIENMIQYIESAEHDILIIDSLTHAWQELLDEVDKIAKKKYRGNSWSAWSEGTPKQRNLIKALLNYPGHLIATMRTKTEWTTEKTSDGKNRPVRVGLSPEQGKGIEYEFDILAEINPSHYATIIKDRTGKYQDEEIDKPGEEFGKELSEWLSDGKNEFVFLESERLRLLKRAENAKKYMDESAYNTTVEKIELHYKNDSSRAKFDEAFDKFENNLKEAEKVKTDMQEKAVDEKFNEVIGKELRELKQDGLPF